MCYRREKWAKKNQERDHFRKILRRKSQKLMRNRPKNLRRFQNLRSKQV